MSSYTVVASTTVLAAGVVIVKSPVDDTSKSALTAAVQSASLYVSLKQAPVAEFISNFLSGAVVPIPTF